jgi:hypothetical protein
MIAVAVLLALALLVLTGLLRITVHAFSGVWGLILQFSDCGCKHVDIGLGVCVIRAHFGRCREKPRAEAEQ